MNVRPVDPRDTEWQVDRPLYRVVVWEPTTKGSDGPKELGFHAAEFELSEVRDIDEVLAWVRERSRSGVMATVYVVVDLAGRRGLIRLVGSDPTQT
jgi:hypothetical protein